MYKAGIEIWAYCLIPNRVRLSGRRDGDDLCRTRSLDWRRISVLTSGQGRAAFFSCAKPESHSSRMRFVSSSISGSAGRSGDAIHLMLGFLLSAEKAIVPVAGDDAHPVLLGKISLAVTGEIKETGHRRPITLCLADPGVPSDNRKERNGHYRHPARTVFPT